MFKIKVWVGNGTSSLRLLGSEKSKPKEELTLMKPRTSKEPVCSEDATAVLQFQPMVLYWRLWQKLQARRYGFSQLLVLSSSKRLVQLFSRDCNPNWQETTIAALATSFPMHYSWSQPLTCKLSPFVCYQKIKNGMVEKFNIYSGILIVSSKPSVKGVGSRIQD